MVTKKEKWDGKSRPNTKEYDKNYRDIFNKLQQEQRDLDESYRQSLKNKKEHTNDEWWRYKRIP